MKRYIVRLTGEERNQLEDIVNKGKNAAYKVKHAQILLGADADGKNLSDEEIAKAVHCHRNTVFNVRQRLVEQGLDAALERKKRETPPVAKILDGEKEARLIAISCSQPPQGHDRWTLSLLAERMVELEIVESISYETVRRTLKKTN
jgi:transposase